MMVIKLILLFQENAFHLFLESLILEPDANHPTGHGEGGEENKTKKRERMIKTTHLLMLFLHLFHEDVFLLILAPFILEPDADNPSEEIHMRCGNVA